MSTSRPWYDAGLRFGCTQCGNCCKSHGEYAYIYLMEPEVEAIAEHLGLDIETFRARHTEFALESIETVTGGGVGPRSYALAGSP